MTDELRSTQNTPEVERDIVFAIRELLTTWDRLCPVFEHGQWWVVNHATGAQWSVVDAEGTGSYFGLSFELVTEPEEDDSTVAMLDE